MAAGDDRIAISTTEAGQARPDPSADQDTRPRPARRLVRGAVGLAALALGAFAVGTVFFDDDGQTSLQAGSPAVPPAAIPGAQATTAPPADVLAISRDGGVVALLDSATGERRRVLATHPPADGGATLSGVALSPDRRTAFYALDGGCGAGTIRSVRTDGEGRSRQVAAGLSPAVSPDGRYLAYAAPGRPRADGSAGCFNAIAVQDLRNGKVRTWRYPDDGDHSGVLFNEASFTKLAWSPGSDRLAFTVSYEGDSISVLDVERHRHLGEATEVVVPGGGGDSRHPAWQASTGRLAVVNRAFECCFDDAYTGPPRTVLVDVADSLAEDLFPPGLAPNGLDFDATGEHLLYVDEDSLFRRAEGSEAVLVAPGYTAADW